MSSFIKLPASSLIEVLIASIILLTTFTIAIKTIAGISEKIHVEQIIKIQQKINEGFNNYEPLNASSSDLIIETGNTHYGLQELRVGVKDNAGKEYRRRRLINR